MKGCDFMSNGFEKLAEGVGNAIQTVPELYEDAFQSTVQEAGKFVARIPRAINAAFSGLDKWILNKEYSVDETKKLLAQKLENVEPEKIVEPEPYVAIPTIQAISYTMNSTELRELYATLLAKSMNTDTKEYVHPAFIETIKQLSPEDAKYFKHIYPLEYRPMLSATLESEVGIYTVASQINTFSKGTKNMPLVIDNLCRLGLIEIPQDTWYAEDHIYDALLEATKRTYSYEKYKDSYPEATTMTYHKSRIDITSYGKAFYNSCVNNSFVSSPI